MTILKYNKENYDDSFLTKFGNIIDDSIDLIAEKIVG